MKKLHPAIHLIRAVTIHVEEIFETLTRGMKHTVPQKETDILRLQESYKASTYHDYTQGRKVEAVEEQPQDEEEGQKKRTKKKRNPDYMEGGTNKLHGRKVITKWRFQRDFPRSTTEDYEALEELFDDL